MTREAVPGDAAALAGVQHRAWHRAYAEWVDPERFGTLAERVARWEALLTGPQVARRTTLVLEVGGRVAGFTSVGPARDEDATPAVGELIGLYVDPPAQGAGVGRTLLCTAEERLRGDAFDEAVLWVFAANAFARDVYERRGWVLEDRAVIARQHGDDWWAPAVRYRRVL